MNTKNFWIFIIMFSAGIGGYLYIKSSAFPALIVNSSIVTMTEFEEHLGALRTYYDFLIKNGKVGDDKIKSIKDIETELERVTLDELVEDELIKSHLNVAKAESLKAVGEKLKEIEGKMVTDQFAQAVQTLYGLSVERFKELALAPQARREVLLAQLATEKKDIDAWESDTRGNASVHILVRGYLWDGKSVILSTKR